MLVIPHHTQAVCGFTTCICAPHTWPYLNTQQSQWVGAFSSAALSKAASILGAQHGPLRPQPVGYPFFNQRNSARIISRSISCSVMGSSLYRL